MTVNGTRHAGNAGAATESYASIFAMLQAARRFKSIKHMIARNLAHTFLRNLVEPRRSPSCQQDSPRSFHAKTSGATSGHASNRCARLPTRYSLPTPVQLTERWISCARWADAGLFSANTSTRPTLRIGRFHRHVTSGCCWWTPTNASRHNLRTRYGKCCGPHRHTTMAIGSLAPDITLVTR